MNKLILHTEKKTLEKFVPSTWDELFLHQALKLIRLSVATDTPTNRFRMLNVLLNLKFWNINFVLMLRRLTKNDEWKLIELTEWIFDSEKAPTKLLLQSIKKRSAKEFQQISFGQFIYADTFFLSYLKTQNEADIHNMLACFYLKKEFDSEQVEKEAPFFRNVRTEKKTLFLMWYIGNREKLVTTYQAIFNGDAPQKERANFGWGGVLHDLSADITKMKEVAKMNIHDVLFSLNKQLIRNKEQEATLKEQQK